MKLMIDAKREGYDTEQCGKTMTVSQLIFFLEQFEDDTPIYLRHDGGYTYGSITEYNITSDEDEEEEE